MGQLSRQFERVYGEISSDIYKLCLVMNFKPTWQQRQYFNAVMRAQYGKGLNWIAVKSGQGPGKTTASVIVAIFRCLQAVNALTIVTAPTMRQCREVWLAEARRLVEKSDPFLQNLVKVTKSKIEIAGLPDWGVKMFTATQEEKAQGFHEKNMTVLCEEASGIPREIITQFKGTLSNPNALFIQIGNPNTRDCAFFDCFHANKDRWSTFSFNAEDTARDYPHIVNPQRNKDLADEFGRDSDVYRVRVLGEFPHTDPNCVLSSEQVEKCMDKSFMLKASRLAREERYGGGIAKQFGIDYARFGGDESTIFRRAGNAIVEWKFFSHMEPSDVTDIAFNMQKGAMWKDDQCWFVADAGGMGQGVMHKFYDEQKQVLEFHNAGKAIDADYDNKITEAWFSLARLVKQEACYLPKDHQLLKQLTTRLYFVNKKGKLILESKDEFVKRSDQGSPDRADGCVMSFYDDVTAAGHISQRTRSERMVGSGANGT